MILYQNYEEIVSIYQSIGNHLEEIINIYQEKIDFQIESVQGQINTINSKSQ